MSINASPPKVSLELISSKGTVVVADKVEIKQDVQTATGKLSKALTMEYHIKGDNTTYSHLWGLDKEPITGSAARILARANITHLKDADQKALAKLKGQEFTVRNNAGKLYWN